MKTILNIVRGKLKKVYGDATQPLCADGTVRLGWHFVPAYATIMHYGATAGKTYCVRCYLDTNAALSKFRDANWYSTHLFYTQREAECFAREMLGVR